MPHPAVALASNLLEHLSILVLDVSSAASTTQEQYDVVLASGIGIVESALEAGMKRAMDRDRDLRKKRKASDGLEITFVSLSSSSGEMLLMPW